MIDQLPNLPPISQATITAGDIEALFSDLRQYAETTHVQIQEQSPTRGDVMVSLADALRAIQRGSAQRIQVRYKFDESQWCDTLIKSASAWRLVRIRLDDQSPGR